MKISEGTSIINNGKIVINGSLTNNGQIEMNKNSTLENGSKIIGTGEIIFGISEYMKNVDTLKRFWGNRISFKNKEGSFSKFNKFSMNISWFLREACVKWKPFQHEDTFLFTTR